MKTVKITILVATTLALFSCKRSMDELHQGNPNFRDICNINIQPEVLTIQKCGAKTVSLCNESFSNIGTVTVETGSDDKVYVTFKTNANWFLKTCYLYAGVQVSLPATPNGMPIPDLFPNIKTYNYPSLSQQYTFVLPNMPAAFEVFSHAEVVRVANTQVVEEARVWGNGCSNGNTRMN